MNVMPPSGRFSDLTLLALHMTVFSKPFCFCTAGVLVKWLVSSCFLQFNTNVIISKFITWCSWFDVFTTVNLRITESSSVCCEL